MSFFFRYRGAFILLAILPLTGCLFRSRIVEPPFISVQLKTATQQQLIDYINTQAGSIQSMQATVDIDTTVGGVKKGRSRTTRKSAATCWRASRQCCG